MLRVSDVLKGKSQGILTISPLETAYKALEIMARYDIGAMLVMDHDQLAGIFSERDYARKVILKGKSSKETPVGDLMTSRVYTITPDRPVDECLALMKAAQCRHLPVFEDGALVNIVTMGDIVSAVITEKDIAIHDLENYITGSDYVKVTDTA